MHLPGISIDIYPNFCFSINLLNMPVTLLTFAGIIALQIALSRREKWWPGLILLAIYAVCHLLRRRKERRQLKKTRIDDL
jgi:hypothetical protein|nr:hypothetical protein [uncultured Oscillibacter sp.]